MRTEKRYGLTAVSSANIDRVAIVQLDGQTMGEYYAKHKPDLMINGSLWDEQGAIGTIVQGGKVVRDEGTGFGFGINAYGWGFADPWYGWQDYITGYPGLVQGGKALSHNVDGYVMTSRSKRSVLAAAGNRLYLIASDAMTIPMLRVALIDFGVYHAINLDGGGSSRLLVDGKAINNPTDDRKCPNAIAVWLKKGEDKLIQPLKIAIDAGHGYHTSGKRTADGVREWTLNNRIAGYVEDKLRDLGISTLRMDDITGVRDVPLNERTSTANSWGADAYISIHHDAGINGGTGGGVTAFCYPSASKKSFELRDAIYAGVIKHGKLKGDRAKPLQTADHAVTRQTKMPAILIECGFMDSQTDVPIIITDNYARLCAQGIAEGVCGVFGVEVASNPPEQIEARHWAQDAYDSLKAKGVKIHETRFDDSITRGEVFVLLDQMK